jgi:DNA helicase HerA-like ATPase
VKTTDKITRIPEAALAQHVAVVGKTGSGKTFRAKGEVERLLQKRQRVCVIDPTGAWYGLKSSADGKSAGFPIVIFGGEPRGNRISGVR